ncbi:MAG: phosphatidylserine decarboxylase [Myxococcales bacterium]|nr:phosphatidylserine decarboxylase [Myxococcales bacterium]
MSAARALYAAALRFYGLLPHRLLGETTRVLGRARWPAPIVETIVRAWVARGRIDLADYEPRAYTTVEQFFLRELRPGARPLQAGFVSPADGKLFAAGELDGGPLVVKQQVLDLARVVNGTQRALLAPAHARRPLHALDLSPYAAGRYATVFLTPHGYHFVHAPVDARLRDVRWIPGRYFPQNATALSVIPRVYERNERAVLRFDSDAGPFLLVMVGASLIGGIELEGLARADWASAPPRATTIERDVRKGERLGHFTFGSTVVCLLSRELARGAELRPEIGRALRLGETLFR